MVNKWGANLYADTTYDIEYSVAEFDYGDLITFKLNGETYLRYFDLKQESPYMLLVAGVKHKNKLEAITHVDGSARVQTMKQERNPFLYKTLLSFEKLSGVPILLNTSFNLAGQPIVESPFDAIDCFKNSNIGALSIGDFIIKKMNHYDCHEIDDYTRFVVSLGKNLVAK